MLVLYTSRALTAWQSSAHTTAAATCTHTATAKQQGSKALVAVMQEQLDKFHTLRVTGALEEADGILSFLYSAKLDPFDAPPPAQHTDPSLGELHQYELLLEVTDAVMDIRMAFLCADADDDGSLSPAELATAVKEVLGGTAPRTAEVQQLIEEHGAPGRGGNLKGIIKLDGFERAMIGELCFAALYAHDSIISIGVPTFSKV
jgi:hypothetical protein